MNRLEVFYYFKDREIKREELESAELFLSIGCNQLISSASNTEPSIFCL